MNQVIYTDPTYLAKTVAQFLIDEGFVSALPPSAMWTKREAADFLKVSTAHVDVLIRERGLPFVDIAKKTSKTRDLRFLPDAVRAWAQNQ